MRILVYPHLMEIGGSQLNAIELAQGVAKRGHEVIVFAPDGDLTAVARRMDFELVRSPVCGRWPSPRNILALGHVVQERRIDVLHGYEWGPSAEMAFGPNMSWGTPMVTTILSMEVPDFLPAHEPIIVGTKRLAEGQRLLRRKAYVLEPPIDTDRNFPVGDSRECRARFGFQPGEIVIAVVCRLTSDLEKLDGVHQAITVVDRMADELPVRLLVVGGGEGLNGVRARAELINLAHGRSIVLVTGGLVDTQPAYGAADVILGMGSSALKGLAFAKPLVVQGAGGYWRTLDSTSLPLFLDQGWFAYGGRGEIDLEYALKRLVLDTGERVRLGEMGRDLVVSRFSLAAAIGAQIEIYENTIADRPSRSTAARSLVRTAVELAKLKVSVNHPWTRALRHPSLFGQGAAR